MQLKTNRLTQKQLHNIRVQFSDNPFFSVVTRQGDYITVSEPGKKKVLKFCRKFNTVSIYSEKNT